IAARDPVSTGSDAAWRENPVCWLQETSAAGGERSRPGLWPILCQPALAGWNVDQSGDHSQKHRALEIYRGDRTIARVQKDGETGDCGAQSRRCQTAPKP